MLAATEAISAVGVGSSSDNSAQIAALQKQLMAAQKKLVESQKGESTKAGEQLKQLIAEQIAAFQARSRSCNRIMRKRAVPSMPVRPVHRSRVIRPRRSRQP